MSRSRTRVGDLKRIFKDGDSDLLNGIGALCILFEDFRHELASLNSRRFDLSEPIPTRNLHELLYYVRRSLVTLDEVNQRLHAICTNSEFRSSRHLMSSEMFASVVESRRYLARNSLLKKFRNYIGAHVDPVNVVQSSIWCYENGSMTTIGWIETDDDFGLQLYFATHILQGALVSNLPGGVDAFSDELVRLFEALATAYKHVTTATYILTRVFLWDRFGIE